MRSKLSLKRMNAASGITATKGAGVYDGRSLVPKATEGEVGDSVCEAPETPLFLRCLLRFAFLSAVAQSTAFTQRGLCALRFV